MPSDPRHFALQAALRRQRVHLEQAVADNDAAIAAWDAIDDRRVDDAVSLCDDHRGCTWKQVGPCIYCVDHDVRLFPPDRRIDSEAAS